ncbi:MAG: GIY-YIG nuclease family protein [Ignavibacteria bacterium]|jgi:putative endonuclease
MKKYFVYIIKSKEGYRYTGMTEDIEKRLNEHNAKIVSFWTKRGSKWKIIFTKEFSNKSEALKYEKWLKSGVGRDFLKNNVENY